MLKSIQQRDLDRNRWIKISMTVILVLICLAMVITLIPGLMSGPSGNNSPDSVATVGGQPITVVKVQQQIAQMERGGNIPPMMRSLYAKQIIDQMIFQQALDLEAQRLGITVTPEELTERIKLYMPDAWSGGVWQKDRYANLVFSRTGMQVPLWAWVRIAPAIVIFSVLELWLWRPQTPYLETAFCVGVVIYLAKFVIKRKLSSRETN